MWYQTGLIVDKNASPTAGKMLVQEQNNPLEHVIEYWKVLGCLVKGGS